MFLQGSLNAATATEWLTAADTELPCDTALQGCHWPAANSTVAGLSAAAVQQV